MARGETVSLAGPLTNLGNTHQRLKQHREAMQYYERALTAARTNDTLRNEMLASLNLGSALSELGRLHEAITVYERVAAHAVTLQAGTTQVWALIGLMRAHAKLTPDDP